VTTIAIGAAGVITITYDAAHVPQLAGANVITLTPNIGGAALAAGLSGNIDWGCAAETSATAAAHGLTVTAPAAGVKGRYVPTECK